jgi:hypothetical protein
VAAVAIALIVGVIARDRHAPSDPSSAPGERPLLVKEEGDTVRVTLGTSGADGHSTWVLQNERSLELLLAHYYPGGAFDFGLGRGVPVRGAGSLGVDGTLMLGVATGKVQTRHTVRPDGSSELEVIDAVREVVVRLRFTREGALIRDQGAAGP